MTRQQQQRIRDGDDLEHDKRHPDQIEQRGRDGNDFGAEPAEPAEREFALLIVVEQAPAWQEPAASASSRSARRRRPIAPAGS